MLLTLSSDHSKTISIRAHLVTLSSAIRLKKAFKKMLLCLGLAVFSIFIPVMHFILVPLFLILSLVIGLKVFYNKRSVQFDETCLCLSCNSPLAPSYPLSDDLKIKCEQCFAQYHGDLTTLT